MAAPQEQVSRDSVLAWLGEVMDPEVPVVSVVDLGLIRDVEWKDGSLVVTVTPTYSGCPATEVIAQSIRDAVQARGVERVQVRTQLAPAWTTDWMSAKGRDALHAYGIAPPVAHAAAADGTQAIDISALLARRVVVPCPQCNSRKTRLLSQFGSTACKALYQCNDCLEPFDYFKAH
ncbi:MULTISPECIES: 1,2-phenylacetyl-CoA epoxidase subunit PaaD [unclassified Variovorax]|uniref:1,2-phenylacetyl-CoA epoxidase subunit PaaD n=1 Tax=unclassified Variovorax TaxID=663243 RepID=UPI001BD4ADF8|nr:MULTISPECIES: 1,2-phenylacetyl-CoA epoxidase subunit PaaD [unclassified Variovorax]